MLKLEEKGAIPRRDNETFAIAPHIPCGFVTRELLRRIADTAEKYNAKAIKITGAARIAIVGLKDEGFGNNPSVKGKMRNDTRTDAKYHSY
jgi:NAD(P)H-nitrite reductase large subunit